MLANIKITLKTYFDHIAIQNRIAIWAGQDLRLEKHRESGRAAAFLYLYSLEHHHSHKTIRIVSQGN